MSTFDLEDERQRIRKEAAKHFLAARVETSVTLDDSPVNEDCFHSQEDEPIPDNLDADIGAPSIDTQKIIVQGPKPKRKRPEKIKPVEDEEIVEPVPTMWKFAEVEEGEEEGEAEEEEEDIVDHEAEDEDDGEVEEDAEVDDAAEVEEEEEDDVNAGEEEELVDLEEEDLDANEEVDDRDEQTASDDIDGDDDDGDGFDDDDAERPAKRRRVAKAKTKPKKDKPRAKKAGKEIVITPATVVPPKEACVNHSFMAYEKRIRRIPAANFSILDGAYLSDYGLTGTLRKATKKGITAIVHQAQVLAQVAQDHDIHIRGFTSENKKKGAYETLPCDNKRESEGGSARVVFIGKFKKSLKDIVGSVFCLQPEEVS